MKQMQDKLMIRLPDGMRPELKARAAFNRRSMNAEVIFLLEYAFQGVNSDGVKGLATDPAAASNNNAALQGGASINHGLEGTADE